MPTAYEWESASRRLTRADQRQRQDRHLRQRRGSGGSGRGEEGQEGRVREEQPRQRQELPRQQRSYPETAAPPEATSVRATAIGMNQARQQQRGAAAVRDRSASVGEASGLARPRSSSGVGGASAGARRPSSADAGNRRPSAGAAAAAAHAAAADNDGDVEIVGGRSGSAAPAPRGGRGHPGRGGGAADTRHRPGLPAATSPRYRASVLDTEQHSRAVLQRALAGGVQMEEVTAQAARAIVNGRGAGALSQAGANALIWGYHPEEVEAAAIAEHQRRHQRQQQVQQQALFAARMQQDRERARAAQAQAQAQAAQHHTALFAVGSPFAIDLGFSRADATGFYALDPDAAARDSVLRQMQVQQQAAVVAQQRQQQHQQQRRAVAGAPHPASVAARAAAAHTQQQRGLGGRVGLPRPAQGADANPRVVATAAALAAERRLAEGVGGRPALPSGAREQERGEGAIASRVSADPGRVAADIVRDRRSTSTAEEAEIITLTSSSSEDEENDDRDEKQDDEWDEPSANMQASEKAAKESDTDEHDEGVVEEAGTKRRKQDDPEASSDNQGGKTEQAERPAPLIADQDQVAEKTIGGERGSAKISSDVRAVPTAPAGHSNNALEGAAYALSKKRRTVAPLRSEKEVLKPSQSTTRQQNKTNESIAKDRREAKRVGVPAPVSNQGKNIEGKASERELPLQAAASEKRLLSKSDSSSGGVSPEGRKPSARPSDGSDPSASSIGDNVAAAEQTYDSSFGEMGTKNSEVLVCADIPIAGPFVQSILSGTKQAIETLEGNSDMAVHTVTRKVLELIRKTENEGQSKSTAKSAGRKRKGARSSDSDAVTLHSDEIERIASEFVINRRRVAKEAVQIAFLEMKKRHDAIVEDATREASKEREQLAMQIAKHEEAQKANYEKEAASSKEIKMLREQNEQLREEAKHMLAKNEKLSEEAKMLRKNDGSLRESYSQDIAELKRENNMVVAELRKNYDESLNTLREEMEEEKVGHSRALNAYMTASCSALRALRKNEEISHII